MATTRFIDHLLEGDHASRPAASAVPQGTLYSCTTHSLIYQSDGTSAWSTWATLGGTGLSDPMTTRGDMIIRNASNVTDRLGRGSAGQVLTSDGTDIAWAAAAGGTTDDTEPSGGTIYRGSAGSTTGWTTGQTPDTFDADSSLPDMFNLSKATLGGGNVVTARRSVGGSFPRTYKMRVGAGRLYQDFQGFGILVGEASPGKYLTWGPIRDGGNIYLQRTLWTNDTTAGGQTNFPTTTDVFKSPLMWLRLDVNSSTDIDGLMSYDGYFWHEYFTAYNPSFTVGTFGFDILAFNAIAAGIGVRWIHET